MTTTFKNYSLWLFSPFWFLLSSDSHIVWGSDRKLVVFRFVFGGAGGFNQMFVPLQQPPTQFVVQARHATQWFQNLFALSPTLSLSHSKIFNSQIYILWDCFVFFSPDCMHVLIWMLVILLFPDQRITSWQDM